MIVYLSLVHGSRASAIPAEWSKIVFVEVSHRNRGNSLGVKVPHFMAETQIFRTCSLPYTIYGQPL